ncbi:hypothetical protein OS493_004642 [Desmophyllum pertusum]|uniref:GREB1-like circularly permuted SF2 helicase domain-containing protein n=1 Tax=Desmophyllum pertusum TaxID=174260 RepID=A0A9W9ZG19_9CNID|nr:hypothetical protein OS493_004642 [Desmophyllum pertusum]
MLHINTFTFSSNGKLVVTSSEDNATDFIVQGSHGIVILKVLATNEQQRAKPLTISTDTLGNLEATVAPRDQQPTKFEVKLDFGVGVVAFGSCENKITTLLLMNMAITLNCSNKNDQKIREDKSFQKIVDKAKRQKKMTTEFSSFPIDALLCAEYCYHILHVSVYDSDEKIRQALTSPADESPAAEFDRRLNSFVRELELRKTTTNPRKPCIDPEAFKLVRRELVDNALRDVTEDWKRLGKLQKQKSSKEKQEEAEEELSTSVVTCLMHFPQQKIKENPRLNSIKHKLQVDGCQAMVQKWKNVVQNTGNKFLG